MTHLRAIFRSWHLPVAGLLLFSLLLTATTAAQAQVGNGRFDPAPCMFDLPAGVVENETIRCGWLTVPERHSQPDGPTIRLGVAIIPSRSATPAPDPLVMAQGGPGGSTLDFFVDLLLTSNPWPERDIILFDQRGTLYTEPNLLCTPEQIELAEETLI